MDERLSRRFDLSSHMCFIARNLNGMLPTSTQAGVYTQVAHYLKSDPGRRQRRRRQGRRLAAQDKDQRFFMTKEG
jgi:hypothetical protein